MPNGQFPEIIKLGDLNGQNGFKLDGEASNDQSGSSVNAAGDINGDGYVDLVVGAYGYASGNSIGRSYVVFGSPEVGSSGLLALSSLNGANGFKLDGETLGDWSSYSVSAAGDINGDGYVDLLIGVPKYANGMGRSYVVFGGLGVGSSGLLALSSLNGIKGFKLDGDDLSGWSLSAAGDINGDGHADLIIGTNDWDTGNNRGYSYVVFGGPGVGSSGVLALSSLNGANGFRLDGGANAGWSVSAGGDINGDSYADLLIGASGGGAGYAGQSYVVFGGPGVGSSGLLALSSLNGANGFRLDGEDCHDGYSGNSVSTADINGDGYADLIIGAPGYASWTGRSYVVFGGPGVGNSGLLALSSLNGINGFKLDGESYSFSGFSVSTAGDINGDGYGDLLVGAPYRANNTGRSYVVFGGPGVGSSGLLALSSLNGANGFKLDGEASDDRSGWSVSTAGDINGDGYDDLLVGAPYHTSSTGRSYVVFGDVPPVLVNNSLVLFSGETISLTASDLAAYDRNHDNSTLVFVPTNVTHGQFELTDNPGIMLSNFTQQKIWDQQIHFVHDGSSEAPAYNITVRSEGIAWTGPISANIAFNDFLNLENNQLVINQGQIVVISSNNLKATYLGNVESDLSFLISDLAHGKFEFLFAPNQSIAIFQQQNITDGVVRFVHDNSQSTPGYRVAVSNGTLTTSAQPASIDFDAQPILVRNSLTIRPGQTVPLTIGNLYATTYNGIADPDLIFIVTDVQNGFFTIPNHQRDETSSQGNITFLQQQVMDNVILFSQQGPGLSLPAYRIAVSDGRVTTSPVSAAVTLQQGQFPEILQLADLNGQNGFRLDGENNGDYSGISVSTAGDINDDGHVDLVIGAAGYPSGSWKGRSYVVFGGPGVGKTGVLLLSSLNGSNGFKLDGENSNDYSGGPVSAAGDINDDGHVDLVIGAAGYPSGSWKGRSYVVFGGPGVGKTGVLLLSSLNGSNGFKLDGENNGDESGVSVSAAGDINGDGYDDVVIGAPLYLGGSIKGRSYVVFGGPGVGKSGDMLLSSLNGSNGFKLDGENTNDYSGVSVSAAGDIDGDGYADVVIGAYWYPGGGHKGRSYVVFGGLGVEKTGVLLLSSLNGSNGFKLNGENNNDESGLPISAAGDLNGDGYQDVMIAAWGYPNGSNKGRSYVVFGGPEVGGVGGDLLLSSLNGSNGFKLDGENNNDNSGRYVSAVGDINGDGYADVVIGAWAYPSGSGKGRSYVVFGGPGVGQSGELLLSSLSGSNGFKLDGENNNDGSGISVSAAGDINGDSVDDLLIGAYGYPSGNNIGRTYVVFGDVPPVLVNNSLVLFSGETIFLSASDLAAYDRNHDNNTLIFIPGNITHGQFESINDLGVMLNNFTQQQIWNQQIQFVHDGSEEAPSYSITVRSEGIAWTGPIAAEITFLYGLLLETNRLVINQDQSVILSSANLKASNMGKEDGDLSFIISNLTHGKFSFIATADQSIFIFQQQNITDGIVQFSHDNTTSAPSYRVTVTNGTLTTPEQPAFIDFDATPILLNNSLVINQGQIVPLTSTFLSATHPGGDDRVLLFNISSVMHGKFSFTAAPNKAILNFYQQNITDGFIQFSHDNSTSAPNYLVSVTDGRITLSPVSADIDFDITPILEVNQLMINQGQTVVFSENNLRATQGGIVENTLEFIISDIQQGQFSWANNPMQSINHFYQQNVTDRRVQFTHNNSTTAPVYKVVVSDGRITTIPVESQIDFDTTPLLVHNQLTIGEGQSITLTNANLLATHNGLAESNLTFLVTSVENGGFILLSEPVQQFSADVAFQQQQVTNGKVVFSSQTSAVPAYRVSVTDGRITTSSQQSNITFFWKPVLTSNQFLANRGQVTVITTANIAATRNGTLAEDLQFVVAGTVQHGRFEQRSNPGNTIISFYQQDILQQIIQFAQDNSTSAPQYSLKVLDNQCGLSSDAQAGKTILVLNNYFPVNQGENLVITESILNATNVDSQNTENIVFTPITGTVQHGHFALTSSPNYPLTSFQQHQISAHEILFFPDNSDNAPSGYLSVSDGQTSGVQGTISCQIDFDVPPLLKAAYLKTSPGERVKITDVNLKAASQTYPGSSLLFEISELSHGYFADNGDNWQKSLMNFSQQKITDGDIIFITDESNIKPEFKVSVWDGRLHCSGCPQSADVVFQGENTPSTPNSSLSDIIKNAIIGAAVSGVIGLLFFALRYRHSLNLHRNARPTIDGEAQDTYSDALLLPIAREIFSRIKITGCLGYIGKRQYNEYIGAISVIVAALETKSVIQPDNWNSLSRPQKQKIIDAIAMHTKELVGNNRCCSARTFTSFYRAEATPRMIRSKAEEIADAVQETLSDQAEAKNSRSRSSVRLTKASSGLQSQLRAPLLS